MDVFFNWWFIYPSQVDEKKAFVKVFFLFDVCVCVWILEGFHDQAKECCEIGQIQAESSQTCTMNGTMFTEDHRQNLPTNCRFLSHICCLAKLRSYFCEEGLKTALRLLSCHQTKFESKDSYQVQLNNVIHRNEISIRFRSVVNVVN